MKARKRKAVDRDLGGLQISRTQRDSGSSVTVLISEPSRCHLARLALKMEWKKLS